MTRPALTLWSGSVGVAFSEPVSATAAPQPPHSSNGSIPCCTMGPAFTQCWNRASSTLVWVYACVPAGEEGCDAAPFVSSYVVGGVC
jgi:hypothetical protein